ncbi:hypothetical protein ABE545_10690 [Sphingobacterium faecium]|uniref:hypothetical protein n=1 Tax=Sphingobacterium faecium TaxID=34087 RepID=UPI003208466E
MNRKLTYLMALMMVIVSFFTAHSEAVAMAGATVVALPIKNSIAEKEMIKQLRHEHTWASEIRSRQNWVNQDTIKIPKRGEAPKVLIDNTNYPIVKNERDDSHVVISLHKFDTENTIVTKDELYALPYEKTSDVQEQHRETLEDTTLEYGLWGLAPQAHDASKNLFVVQTTGEDDGTGYKKLTSKDLRKLQADMNKKGIAKRGRILILSDDHVSNLLEEDAKFSIQYHNKQEGTISKNYYGFVIYEDSTTPAYDDTSLQKLPYGSATVGRKSSVIFHAGVTAKAAGSVERFARPAELDPENRENTVGFRLWHIIVTYGVEGSAAIIPGKV